VSQTQRIFPEKKPSRPRSGLSLKSGLLESLARKRRAVRVLRQKEGISGLLLEILHQGLKPLLMVYEGVVWRWNRARGRTCFNVHGHALTILPEDHGISRELSVYQIHEPLTTELVKQFLKPGMNVVDIGGNLGYYALLEAQMVGDAGRVIAIEPVASNFAQLSSNVAANGYRNVILENVAIGTINGSAPIYLSKKSNWHSLQPVPWETSEVTVRVSTLDSLLARHELPSLDLIRMDLEGYEIKVIRGMKSTIKKYRPRLLIELHPQVVGAQAMITFLKQLKALGYELEWVLDNERDRPIRWRFLQAEKISLEDLLSDSRITTDTRTLMVLLSNKLARQFRAEPNSGWTPTETVFGD
jgi:FkbM family methyltransferase